MLLRKLLVSDSVGGEGYLDCLRVPPPCGRVPRLEERPEKYVNPQKDYHFLDQVKHGGHRPGTLPHQSHVGGVSAKVGYVLAHPE